MRKLLVFQHVAFEILGTLNPLLKAAGFRIHYVNFGRDPEARPCLEGYCGLVILGGPMHVDDVKQHPHLATEIDVIRDAIGRGVPVLGICLGGQLVAKALGARVRRSRQKEIGWFDVWLTREGKRDALLRGLNATERVFQWHGDTFDVPDGAVHLVTSTTCESQAFRYGATVYGFQFHLEVDERLIERWLRVPLYQEEIRNAGIDPRTIRAETPLCVERTKDLSREVFGAFIELFGLPPKRVRAPSK